MTSIIQSDERDKEIRAINIGRLKTHNLRTKRDNWGRKRAKNVNGPNGYRNGCAKKITRGDQKVSQNMVSDQ